MKFEGEGQIDPPNPRKKKLLSKSPALLGLRNTKEKCRLPRIEVYLSTKKNKFEKKK